MDKKYTRLISIISVIFVIIGMLAGCGQKKEDGTGAVQKEAGTAAGSENGAETSRNEASNASEKTEEANKEFSYPLNTDVTLTYWMQLNGNVSQTAKSMADTPFAQELMKQTGIKIEYQHPPLGQEKESFNIMLASRDLPDIIEYSWAGFPGGPEKAMTDGVILQLNDTIDQYAPNLKAYLNKDTEVNKMIKTDTGKYYVFPSIRGDDFSKTYAGPIVRKDWLDDCGLAIPETIDEWTAMLRMFKEKKNAEAPLSCYWNESFITGAFGIVGTFYIDEGKFKYGPIEPEYKDYILLYRKWYEEGLLDKNFATLDPKTMDANILGGKTGATIGLAASGIGKWLNAMKEKDPKYDLIGTPYPTLKKGDRPKFGHTSLTYIGGGSAAISTSCKNVELAARFLDYSYSDKGALLYNYGIENVSYTVVNGKPEYTELITNNPEKLSNAVALAKYARASYAGPFVQDKGYAEQNFTLPQQKEAISRWIESDASLHIVPWLTPTPEESSEQAKIISQVSTLLSEKFIKFVMGEEPIEKYDAFVEEMKKMGIERAIELKQGQLDRYNMR